MTRRDDDDEVAPMKPEAAAHALCAKQETWFIEPPIPTLIRNPCPPSILKSLILNSGGPSNMAFGKIPMRRARPSFLLPAPRRHQPTPTPNAPAIHHYTPRTP